MLLAYWDASRTGYAEAKSRSCARRARRSRDASRTGYAEAKRWKYSACAEISRCKPPRLLCKAKANVCRKAGNI